MWNVRRSSDRGAALLDRERPNARSYSTTRPSHPFGNDPVTFTDPFGLKVEFDNERAQALYEKIRQQAEYAIKSRNSGIAAAGRALLKKLQALEADEEVVTISVGSYSQDGFGVNRATGKCGIVFDEGSRGGIVPQIRLTHELGHAYNAMVDGVDPNARSSFGPSNARALETENHHRAIWGCKPRVVHDAALMKSKFIPTCP